jgi:hypothetical protein
MKHLNLHKAMTLTSALVLSLILALGCFGLSVAQADDDIAEVVISEIMKNPDNVYGDEYGEWFELYNPSNKDININGWTIEDDDDDSHEINNEGALIIPAKGYLVLGSNSDFATNGNVPVDYAYDYSEFSLYNRYDEIVIRDTDENVIDSVRYNWGANATFPDLEGASMALVDLDSDNSVGENWCRSNTMFADPDHLDYCNWCNDHGTPGAANSFSIADPGDVVINEIMKDPDAAYDSSGEWIELYNSTNKDIDITGWTIADNDTDSHAIAPYVEDTGDGSLIIPAKGYLVLGRNYNTAYNGDVEVHYEYWGFNLGNVGDEVILLDSCSNVIDIVEYNGGDNSTFPDPEGASMALKDPDSDNNDAENWCTSTTPWNDGDSGTPGEANDCPEEED